MIQFSQDGLNLPHFVWEAIQICLNQHLDVRLENSGLRQTQNDAPDNFNALTNSKPFVKFEVLANSKSRPGQIQGFDNFQTMHQTNLGHRQIGNDDPDKFGAWSVEATGGWASSCPDMELEKIGLKPVSLFLRFLIYGIFLNFEKIFFLYLNRTQVNP